MGTTSSTVLSTVLPTLNENRVELEDIPPEVLIIVFSYLRESEVYSSIVFIARYFFNVCEKHHYWKLMSERFKKETGITINLKKTLKERGCWKRVYFFLYRYIIRFDPESIHSKFIEGASFRNENKTFTVTKRVDAYPTISFNSSVQKGTIWRVYLLIRNAEERIDKQYCWGHIGLCEKKNYSYCKRGNSWIGSFRGRFFGNPETTAFEFSGMNCNKRIIFEVDLINNLMKLRINGESEEKKINPKKIKPPLKVVISFPQFVGQIIDIEDRDMTRILNRIRYNSISFRHFGCNKISPNKIDRRNSN